MKKLRGNFLRLERRDDEHRRTPQYEEQQFWGRQKGLADSRKYLRDRTLVGNTFYLGTKLSQFLLNSFVAPVDMIDSINESLAFCREPGQHQTG